MCPIRILFFRRKDQIYTRHCSKQTSKLSQLQNQNLNLLTITFPAIYLLNRSKSLFINQWWEWIILSVRSLTAFEENIVVTVLAKFFYCFKVCWKPFKSPLSVRKWKCFSEASLFNLNYLYFNYHLLAQKLLS